MLNERTELHIFDRGSVTGDRYCEEVLLPHVRLFRGAIDPDFIFMDDNARLHRTLAVGKLLESEDISRMDWPAYSPDLNLIEHVWDALRRRVAARLHHPEITQQLKQMLIEEWTSYHKKCCTSWFGAETVRSNHCSEGRAYTILRNNYLLFFLLDRPS
ncbi:transposable element Tcb2 transposase [Trichonephila clavipes]|nr:transposable element Tcb2 transposase [Trichonephila clavipes]